MVEHNTTLRVRFTGDASRSGPRTMGQANMLRCIARDNPAHINMHAVWDVSPGTDLDRVVEIIAILHGRHETLRTTYPDRPEPLQLVHATGELTVEVCPAAGDAARFAEELGLRRRAIRFDPATEWPLRITVVTAGGAPVHLVLALSHAALDASAIVLLRREWHALLAGAPLPEPAPMRPVDLAALERSAEGRRRSAASLDYWGGQLRTVPQAMFAVPAAGPARGETPRLRIRSHAAADALTTLTERTGVSRSALVLTALCALTAHRTGQSHAVVTSLSANRYLPELADYLGTVAQDALVTVPVDLESPTGFEALARRVRKRTQLAYPNSWFDSVELWERIERTGFERGTRYSRDCVFNDLSPLGLDGGVPGAAADPRDRGQAVQSTWLPPEPLEVDVMLWAFRLERELDLWLWANPARLATADAEAFGRGIATLLIEAARGDVKLAEIEAITGLAPVVRGPRWRVADGCWIDLDQMDDLLATVLAAEYPGAPPAFRVEATPDPRFGHRLTCHLTGADLTGADLARIHAACVAALAGRPAAMAPHDYRIAAGPREPITGTGRP